MVEQNGREFMSEARNEVGRQAGGPIHEKLLGLNAQNTSEHMKMAEKELYSSTMGRKMVKAEK